MRWKGGVKQFRVRWVDYGSEDDTWEPQENIHPSDIQEFLEVQAGECEATDDESDAEEPAQPVPAKASAKPAVAKRKVPAPRVPLRAP